MGFFKESSYCVLPYFTNHNKAVYFPNLNYSENFWNKIKKTKYVDLVDQFPKSCVNEVLSKLDTFPNSEVDLDYNKLTKKYNKYTREVNEIEILETKFGTVGSYYAKNEKIYMTQKSGNESKNFEKTLILAIMKHKNKDVGELGSLVWHKRIAVAEYFLGKLKDYVPQKYKVDSKKYLQKLGFDIKIDMSKINTKKFTVQEENVFNTLYRHRGEVVSFDTLANVLWEDKADEKYSLEAMAKVIENLRKKIINQGINKEIIVTKRGKGYFLQN